MLRKCSHCIESRFLWQFPFWYRKKKAKRVLQGLAKTLGLRGFWKCWKVRRTERCLSNAEEEANEYKALIVLGQCCTRWNNCPCSHTDSHVDWRPNLNWRHQHVWRDLHQEISIKYQFEAGTIRRWWSYPTNRIEMQVLYLENKSVSTTMSSVYRLLGASQTQVILDVVQSRVGDGIAVEIVHEVHSPECGHDPHI